MNTADSAHKTVGLIPEVYVDLIRRVTPGGILVAFALISLWRRNRINLSPLPNIPQVTQGYLFFAFLLGSYLFLLFLFASYVVGLLIDSFTGQITSTLVGGGQFRKKKILRIPVGGLCQVP